MNTVFDSYGRLVGITNKWSPLIDGSEREIGYRICPYCKNRDTDRIVPGSAASPATFEAWQRVLDMYGDRTFKLFACSCCGSEFHYEVEKLAGCDSGLCHT